MEEDQNNGSGDNDTQSGSLLDEEADHGEGTGEGSSEGSSGGDGDGGGQVQALVDALLPALEDRLGQRFDSVADRRVNALLREMREQGGGSGDRSRDDRGGDQDGDRGQGRDRDRDRRPRVDERAARLAFREYVTDEIRFISSEERALASDLAAGMLRTEIARGGDDEDRIGRDVARNVARQVKAIRKHYEDRTVAALKRKGLLEDGKDGQPPKSRAGTKTQQSEFDQGAELAKARYAQPAQDTT